MRRYTLQIIGLGTIFSAFVLFLIVGILSTNPDFIEISHDKRKIVFYSSIAAASVQVLIFCSIFIYLFFRSRGRSLLLSAH